MTDATNISGAATNRAVEALALAGADLAIAHPVLAAMAVWLGLLASRFIFVIAAEYLKLWIFKGIPPWRVERALLQNLESMQAALDERNLEFEAYQAAVNKALDRAEQHEHELIALRIENIRLREVLAQSAKAKSI